jgi:hypothetical protein
MKKIGKTLGFYPIATIKSFQIMVFWIMTILAILVPLFYFAIHAPL